LRGADVATRILNLGVKRLWKVSFLSRLLYRRERDNQTVLTGEVEQTAEPEGTRQWRQTFLLQQGTKPGMSWTQPSHYTEISWTSERHESVTVPDMKFLQRCSLRILRRVDW